MAEKIGTVTFKGSIVGFKQSFVKGGSYLITIQTKCDPQVGAILLSGTQHGECIVDAKLDLEEGQLALDDDEDQDGLFDGSDEAQNEPF